MTVTESMKSCFMFFDASGCLQQGTRCTDPNPANPTDPIVTYMLDGVTIDKPDEMITCPNPENMQGVYVYGGKLDLQMPECPAPTSIGVITDMTLLDTP